MAEPTPITVDEIAAALAAISTTRRNLEQSIESAKRQREELIAAPLCKDDVLSVMLAQLDRDAAAAPSRLDQAVKLIAERPGKADSGWPRGAPIFSGGPAGAEGIIEAVIGLLADPLKDALEAAFDLRPEVPNAGLPRAERAPLIAALDAAIERDEAALAQLIDDARRAGLSLRGGLL